MTIYIVLGMLFVHWFADFVLQDPDDAVLKSTSKKHLLSHTIGYSLVWYTLGVIYVLFNLDTYIHWHLTYFVLITFTVHTITDYFTSKLNSKLWKIVEKTGSRKAAHNFFVSVGFDQFLHFLQLFLTFKLLF